MTVVGSTTKAVFEAYVERVLAPPSLPPIEEAFSEIKALLRKAKARSRDALVEAIGRALSAVTARDTCGYPLGAQPS